MGMLCRQAAKEVEVIRTREVVATGTVQDEEYEQGGTTLEGARWKDRLL